MSLWRGLWRKEEKGGERQRVNQTPNNLKSRCSVDDETAGWFVPDGFSEFARQQSHNEPSHPPALGGSACCLSLPSWPRLGRPNVPMFSNLFSVVADYLVLWTVERADFFGATTRRKLVKCEISTEEITSSGHIASVCWVEKNRFDYWSNNTVHYTEIGIHGLSLTMLWK